MPNEIKNALIIELSDLRLFIDVYTLYKHLFVTE